MRMLTCTYLHVKHLGDLLPQWPGPTRGAQTFLSQPSVGEHLVALQPRRSTMRALIQTTPKNVPGYLTRLRLDHVEPNSRSLFFLRLR
jgi:hypothetical protein